MPFTLDHPDYSITPIDFTHTTQLQALFERYADYALIVEGGAVSPHAAQEALQETPPGRSLADKFLYCVWHPQAQLVGVLEGMRGYPDESTWWIGLLLLDPAVRGQGLGRRLVQRLGAWAQAQGATALMLGVMADNHPAFAFWRQQGFDLVRVSEPRTFGKKVQTVSVLRKALPAD
jgi:GNAT superfamily N-acetyltransferase